MTGREKTTTPQSKIKDFDSSPDKGSQRRSRAGATDEPHDKLQFEQESQPAAFAAAGLVFTA